MAMSTSDNSKVRKQAAEDLAYVLSGEATLSACDDIDRQGDNSPEYDKEYQGLADLMAGIECLRSTDVVANTVAQAGRQNHWWRYAIAASLLLSFASVFWWTVDSPENGASRMDRYVTRVGEQKQVTLDGGSTVYLNTNSELLVPKGEGQEHVVLRRGEAFFDIEKSPDSPFSIEVAGRIVTVLGTSFNIRVEPDLWMVDVATGSVVIHKPDEEIVASLPSRQGGEITELPAEAQVKLISGQMATLATNGGVTLLAHSEGSGSWRSGRLEFKQVPLYLVVKELNRYSAKKILIEDTSIIELPISAMFSIDRIHVLLSGVSDAWGIKVTNYPDRIVLVAQ